MPTGTVEYSYDGFYRASYDVNVNNTDILTTDYTFVNGVAENSTTTLVESMTTSGSDWSDTLSYTYDCKGNIETISENGTQKAKYYYDDLNQLIREDNAWLGKTIAYTYDNGGNILSVSEYTLTSASDISALVASSTDIYAYTDFNWKDKLTSFNGNTITYDEIGNPLTYYNGYEFDWQNGRQLVSVSASDLSISYKYDSSGIRTEKTVNGVTTTYTLEGSNIVKETNGTDTIWYYYDAAGSLTGFEFNGTPYFYVSNIQGDIVAITNADGNIVVEYVYDSWGKLISTTGSLANTIGIKNPYRYRGYYYDTETGLYYLNSRYYDASTKRFVNADGYASTGQTAIGNDMFTYCLNNSVNYADATGRLPVDSKAQREAMMHGGTGKFVGYTYFSTPKLFEGTITLGISVSAYWNTGYGASIGVAIDDKGDIGLIFTLTKGEGTPSIAANWFLSYTNAPSVDKLKGESEARGGSVSVNGYSFSGEYSTFNDSDNPNTQYQGYTISGDLFSESYIEYHEYTAYSWDVIDLLQEWFE